MGIMQERQIGQLITTLQGRDAIHVPIIPVTSKEDVFPGSTLKYIGDGEVCPTREIGHGVADPFLRQVATAGSCFWMFLYPGSIDDLRHVWVHNDFDAADLRVVPWAAAREGLADYTHEGEGD